MLAAKSCKGFFASKIQRVKQVEDVYLCTAKSWKSSNGPRKVTGHCAAAAHYQEI